MKTNLRLPHLLCTLGSIAAAQNPISAPPGGEPRPQDPPAAPAATSATAAPRDPQSKPPDVPRLPPVTVTAFRQQQDPFEVPRSLTVADTEAITRRDRDSILDALDRRIGVWVEKRTATTSDPVIRGLSGGNVLALVDGDSLTTFWGEGGFAGDDLYGKVEAESIERIEMIRGPASVEYGSNALGAVINFHTRKPRLPFPEAGAAFGGRLKAGFDTVNEGKTARLDVETALPWLRWRLGGTWRDLADGEGGDGVGRLRPSGGEDVNFDLNAEARDGSEGTWFLNAQRVRRDDLARYYKPTERNENDRDAVSFGWRSAPAGSGEGLEARVYWQEKEDRRYYLATGNVGRAEWQSLSTDWTWRSDQVLQGHRLLAGLTLRRDLGESPDDEQFTITRPNGVVTKAAPDQTWYDAGLFLRDDWRFAPQWTLSGGLRFDHFWYDADPDALYQPAVGSASLDDVDVEESSWTGGLGLVFEPADSWRTYASWSRGFRMFAPRFGISKTGYGVLVPSGVLEPVVGDSFELGVRHRRAMVETNLAGYYTRFDGFQNPVASTFEGQQFYDYNRNGTFEPDERVYVTAGNGEAWVGGIEWDARFDLHEAWSVLPNGCFATAGFMWNHGEDQTNDVPLRHTHPARGLLSVGYEEPEGLWYVELTADFVDAFTDIDPARLRSDVGYRRNPQDPSSPLVREDGLPGYTLVHLEAGARLGERARCGFEIDNLTDVNYRAAHSRMDGFGINLGLWFEVTF